MSITTLVILLLVLSAVAVIVLLLRNASRGRRLNQDIPPALRPAYSDEQLETTVLERTMQWGLILTVIFAIFLPVYWLIEPNRQTSAQEAAFIHDFEDGERLFVDNCSRCHGADASGGGATSTYDPEDSWPAPNLRTIVARYDGTDVTDIQDYLENTIKRGRPGTPMPPWGAAFGGPMTDHQIERIARWILANQDSEVDEATPAVGMTGEELFNANCVRCHGDEGQGFIGPSLVGVFERHNEKTVLGILQNGIFLANGISMPPWQTGYMYPESRYTDSALRRIIGHLHELQPTTIPEESQGYATPYQGEPRGEGGQTSGDTGGETTDT
jgi:mono/diheme cytochrome c family protein